MKVAFYKGTQAGVKGIYNRLVRWVTRSKYSHCELVFSTGRCGSASFTDGGVRKKFIEFNEKNWDFVEVQNANELFAIWWFEKHDKEKYDLLGNLHLLFAPIGDDRNKWFCSEAVAAALGIKDAWRFDPEMLFLFLTQSQHEH